MTVLDYIAEHTLTLPTGHTLWTGELHPQYGWPCVPSHLAGRGSRISVAGYLYGYWRTPGTYLRFRKPLCGLSSCLLPECQDPYDVPRKDGPD